MKIVNLMEDTPGGGHLYEHGLSFYIETAHHKLLCDTGASPAFIQNAAQGGIDLEAVDTVVISHGHYDHTGGLLAFAECNPTARIYIHKQATGAFYSLKNGQAKYIGMDQQIASLSQVVWLGGNVKIDDEISVFTNIRGRRLWPTGNRMLRRKVGEDFVQDEFDHEQYLVVTEGDCRVLISGCAHCGILNILDGYRMIYGGEPTHIISGFHTVKPAYTPEDDALIETIAYELRHTDIRFYSGHCTGDHAMQIFQRVLGDRLTVLHSGMDMI